VSEALSFPPLGTALRQLRADVRGVATRMGGDEGLGDVLALVADELVNNAIEHGAAYRTRNLDLRLTLDRVDERWRVAFHDPEMPRNQVAELAASLADVVQGMPSLESERGRGLFLLSVYLEEITAEADPAGGLLLAGWVARS
jgi:anti-sigma regulatory factor (Ser/Thr protein kinase)